MKNKAKLKQQRERRGAPACQSNKQAMLLLHSSDSSLPPLPLLLHLSLTSFLVA
jgi:hypothetical protein